MNVPDGLSVEQMQRVSAAWHVLLPTRKRFTVAEVARMLHGAEVALNPSATAPATEPAPPPRQRKPSPWEGEQGKERIAYLRTLWPQPYTAQQMAKAIGVSKNALLGKAHRLGLPERPDPIGRSGPSNRVRHADPFPFSSVGQEAA